MCEQSTEGYVRSAAMKLAWCAALGLGLAVTRSKRGSKAQEADWLGAGPAVYTSQPISQRLPPSRLLLFNSTN